MAGIAVPEKKGTVTALSSLFPADEAQKASKRVQDTIAERQQQLDQLKGFINDNANLINLVQRLPDELHHDIMVPFGKAAFFPGRLIHSNEFMVLLGEGYYAERTSKQTIDILKRRGKSLENQVESLKAVMQDLKAEASFFVTTATEAAEGLVEIREDYDEETSFQKASSQGKPNSDSSGFPKGNKMRAPVQDEEYARILSRMDELEKEEEEAEMANKNGVHEIDDELNPKMSQLRVEQPVTSSEVGLSNAQLISRDGASHGKGPARGDSSLTDKVLEQPEVKEKIRASTSTRDKVASPSSIPGTNTNKAFTGSIVEHAHNIGVTPTEQTSSRSSKPVSRFKMQRK